MPYSIEEHQHRFAAWAAGSAASVNGCRFKVSQAKRILEDSGLKDVANSISNLPQADNFDAQHRKWRNTIINAAQNYYDTHGNAFEFTHGIAAKLINIYLKSIYVCSGRHDDPRVKAIHPPIDSVLLDALYERNIGGMRTEWQAARRARWSKLDNNQYEKVIAAMQGLFPDDGGDGGGVGLWRVEEYWQGYQ